MTARDRNLGTALRAFRIRARINQFEMARALDVSQSQISRWESGRDVPRAQNAEAIRALVFGHSDPQFVALIHFVETSGSAMALFDCDHTLVVASKSLTHPGAPFAHWGWLFDPGINPAFAPVYQRYRAVLANPQGTIGLLLRVPFAVGDEPWLAEARKTIHAIGGAGVCVAEIAFLPAPGNSASQPTIERIAPSLGVARVLRRRQASHPLLGA